MRAVPARAKVLAFTPPPSEPAAAATREIEIKFDLDEAADPAAPGALSSALEALGGEVRTRGLVSTYFDDADHSLSAAGFALRIRQTGDGLVQTIKSDDGGLFSRGEWEVPVSELAPDLDAAGRTPLAKLLKTAGPLRPLFTNHIERLERTVAFAGGVVEIALDIGEVEADGGRRAPVRQLELELKSGRPEILFELARSLSEAAPLRLSFETKAGLGYGLLSPPPSCAKGEPPKIDAGMTVGEAFQAVARAALRQIVINERILRTRRASEALHQLRVGLRRLRTALTLFRPVVIDGAYDGIKAELKWLSGQLDQGRDTDVFAADTYQPGLRTLGEADGVAALGKRLKQAQTRGYDQALKALKSRRGTEINLRLAEWIEAGDWLAKDELAGQSAAHFAEGVLHSLDRKVIKKGAHLVAMAPPERHRLRIAVKKLRYGLEFFGGLYPAKRTAALIARLKTFQDSLGGLNDIAVARRTAARLAEGAPSHEVAFAAGLVAGLRADGEATLLKQAADQHRALKKASRPW